MSSTVRQKLPALNASDMLHRDFSSQAVFLHQAIADHLGIHVTDWKCLSEIEKAGTCTAGDLAVLTGLTTGAITGVIDRLEAARFVQRVRDPEDRRRVLVEILPDRLEEVFAILQPLADGMRKLQRRYTAREQAVIEDFLTRSMELSKDVVAGLREKR